MITAVKFDPRHSPRHILDTGRAIETDRKSPDHQLIYSVSLSWHRTLRVLCQCRRLTLEDGHVSLSRTSRHFSEQIIVSKAKFKKKTVLFLPILLYQRGMKRHSTAALRSQTTHCTLVAACHQCDFEAVSPAKRESNFTTQDLCEEFHRAKINSCTV